MTTDPPAQDSLLKKVDLFFAVVTKAFLALAIAVSF